MTLPWTSLLWVFLVLGFFAILILAASAILNRLGESNPPVKKTPIMVRTANYEVEIEQSPDSVTFSFRAVGQEKPYTEEQVRGWYNPWLNNDEPPQRGILHFLTSEQGRQIARKKDD